jgi:hypothetical protein
MLFAGLPSAERIQLRTDKLCRIGKRVWLCNADLQRCLLR